MSNDEADDDFPATAEGDFAHRPDEYLSDAEVPTIEDDIEQSDEDDVIRKVTRSLER
jgi:hypothetical protein